MRPLRVVVDTNVLVSALLNPSGLPRKALDLAHEHEIHLSLEILLEYGDVLNRAKFDIAESLVDKFLTTMIGDALLVFPKNLSVETSDPDDQRFLECAKAADADYLITGNTNHFPQQFGRTQIVTP